MTSYTHPTPDHAQNQARAPLTPDEQAALDMRKLDSVRHAGETFDRQVSGLVQRITELQADNARLREALAEALVQLLTYTHNRIAYGQCDKAIAQSRAALADTTDGGNKP